MYTPWSDNVYAATPLRFLDNTNIYYNDINNSVEIVVRFAVPARKSGTVGTVPTVPGATAVKYILLSSFAK